MSGVYVALGDSMSIDDYAGGAGRGAASLLYRNCDADFPEWAGRELAATGLQAQILARDGATAADVLGQQLPLIEQPPAVVTLTMGGWPGGMTHSWRMSTAGSWAMAPPPEPRPRCCPGPPAATCGTATSSSPARGVPMRSAAPGGRPSMPAADHRCRCGTSISASMPTAGPIRRRPHRVMCGMIMQHRPAPAR